MSRTSLGAGFRLLSSARTRYIGLPINSPATDAGMRCRMVLTSRNQELPKYQTPARLGQPVSIKLTEKSDYD